MLGSHPGGGEKRKLGPGGGLVQGEARHRPWEQLALQTLAAIPPQPQRLPCHFLRKGGSGINWRCSRSGLHKTNTWLLGETHHSIRGRGRRHKPGREGGFFPTKWGSQDGHSKRGVVVCGIGPHHIPAQRTDMSIGMCMCVCVCTCVFV